MIEFLTSCMKIFDKRLPFQEVEQKVEEFRLHSGFLKGFDSQTKLLEHCLVFAEHQYGARKVGKGYRERGGSRISHWAVEINCFYGICSDLGEIYRLRWESSSMASEDNINKALHYYEKCLSILEPLRIQVDSDKGERIDSLNEEEIDFIYCMLLSTGRNLGDCHRYQCNYQKAEDYYNRAVKYAMRIIGEKKQMYYFAHY